MYDKLSQIWGTKWLLRIYSWLKIRVRFIVGFFIYQAKSHRNPRQTSMGLGSYKIKPVFKDATTNTFFDSHYVYHTAWAARVLKEKKIKHHIDIGSHHYFAALVSAFIPLDFYDYRPLSIDVSGLSCRKADLTQLDFTDNSIYSLSCMHVVEHIGLGRYGDPIDPNSDIKAMIELSRVVEPGGHLLFVVPVGKPKLCFNAHRIYNPTDIINIFNNFKLLEFAVVTDKKEFIRFSNPEFYKMETYACGMYHFQKT